MNFEITLGLFDILNIFLVLGFIAFGIYYLSNFWSNKVNKPYKWENAIANNEIPKELIAYEKSYFDKIRLYNIWFQISRINKSNIIGAFAELGVYQGETAKIISLCAPEREFFLFDTFEGFDNKDLSIENSNDDKYNDSNFSDTKLDEVKAFIGINENTKYFKGYFPDTLTKDHGITYAFVNLDADLYAPTLAALKYFYPRLAIGGTIIIHDYNHNWDGNRKAVDEFMQTINEIIIEVADWQGSAMIIKSQIL
ncbi:MAG: class I SAM-dependent methyltransferase [Bacteroidales bacterium]|nr:class I SAM-dependent methyltransferase [Bacteroidales bacterium]